jgi:copper resistance protein B
MRTHRTATLTVSLISGAAALVFVAPAALAQHAGHTMPMPSTPAKQETQAKPRPKPKPKPAAPKPTVAPAAAVDHTAMDHGKASTSGQSNPANSSMQGMDHSSMQGMDHSQMGHTMPQPAEGQGADDDMQGMDHSQMGDAMPAPTQPREPIPTLTDADRAAAFPDVAGHAVHDRAVTSYFLFNRLEAFDADEGTGFQWEGQGWIGGDINRLWLRSEGERVGGLTESADLEVLYGRGIARWWDLVAGVRHDFKPGESQSFAAIGIQGLAPQKFEVEATAYVGERGQTAARFEAEYELLLTNRLILQPLVEVNLFGKDDPSRGIGSGLSTAESGLRLRYEFTRKFAPYIGVVYERAYGGTADFRRDEGEDIDDTRLVIGLRTWF